MVIGKTSQNMQLGPDGRHLPLRFCRSTLAKEAGVVERIFFCQVILSFFSFFLFSVTL